MFRLLPVVFLSLIGTIGAAECTDNEEKSITDAYAAAAATSACSPWSSSNIMILIVPPCSATDCVAVMQDVAVAIPNCTTPGLSTSGKDQLLRSLDICATPAPTPASTASTTNCTSSEAEATFNAFYEAANGSCASSTTIEHYSIIIDTPCTSTCATTVQDFAQSLPNCNYELSNENTNKKQDIVTQFSYCEMLDNATNISVYVDSVNDLLGSTETETPVLPNCTTEEIDETVAFYLTVATNETCVYDSSICAYDVYLNADCDSPCGRLIQRLGFDVPRCYFDHVNHRERLSDSYYQCDWIVFPENISTSFHYSEVLNATGNTSNRCDPKFDSTVSSSDGAFEGSSGQDDSAASKSHQILILCTAALVVAVTLALCTAIRTLSATSSMNLGRSIQRHSRLYSIDMTRVLVALALLISSSLAASDTCTVFQIHTTIQDIDGILSNDKCADYVANSSSLLVPCDASSCVSAVKELVTELPDCTLSASDNGGTSVNKKNELQAALETCSEDSSASLHVEAVDTSRTSSTTSSGDECTTAEASRTADLYLEAARSSACERYVTTDEMAEYIYAPCSASQCIATMEKLAEQLPNCFIDGDNLKQDVQQSLAQCTGSSSVGSSPRSGNECTSDEVSSLAYLTNSIITSKDCESYVVATETEWFIQVPCSATTCLSVMDEAVQQMPDCEFEGINYKDELGIQQQSCVDSAGSNETSGSASKSSLSTAAPALDSSNSTKTSASTLYTAGVAAFLVPVVVIITLTCV